MNINNSTQSTKWKIALASGVRCVRPGCNQQTHLYDSAEDKLARIGGAAHDAPVSDFGTHANALTEQQAKAHSNGVWLCKNCAALVGMAKNYFPLVVIRKWQRDASQALADQTASPVPPQHVNHSEAVAGAEKFLKLLGKITFEGPGISPSVSFSTKAQIDRVLGVCDDLLPHNEFSTLYSHTVNVQKRMLADLLYIKKEIDIGPPWWRDDGSRSFQLADPIFQSEKNRNIISESAERVSGWIDDYHSAYRYMKDFGNAKTDPKVLYLW